MPLALMGCLGAAALGVSADSSGVRSWDVYPGTGDRVGFTLLSPATTGVRFTNILTGDLSLTNAVAHNGSGVALGDVDGDGWQDIYFCGLQGRNRLYRNLGAWRFEEVDPGVAACAGQLSTGAVFADVDGDGDLDLLVNGIAAGTRLFLNDGKGHWTEAANSGLSRTASAMSLALADIDGDGDLDLYCAHYIDNLYLADPTTRLTMGNLGGRPYVAKVNGQSADLPPWKDRFEVLPNGEVHELAEVDGFYRNDGRGHFTPIQFESGVFQDEEGHSLRPYRDLGLGVMFHDINGDGAPDLYVCNDNGAPDRFWINNGKGQFREIGRLAIRHGSHSSMGVDFSDINRDGHDDFLVLDMLARSHAGRMRHPFSVDAALDTRERIDSRPLFRRNTLFLGRADGSFAEAALMAGIAATDWSWCPIFLDVDLDGFEDLLITNGFEQDVLDQDSIDAISKRKWSQEQLKRYRGIHPKWESENLSYRNRGDGTFEPMGARWGFNHPGVSNGMAVADLDNDGDLDVVVNNLNAVASVYRNDASPDRISVRLKGASPNTQGIGARLTLFGAGVTQSQEMISGGRYLSGDQAMRVFAAGKPSREPRRLEVRWRNGDVSTVTNILANHVYEIEQATANKTRSAPKEPPGTPYFTDVSSLLGQVHVESPRDDWAVQPTLPHRLSRLGPGLAWHDFNSDGWEDLIVTAAQGGKLAVLASNGGTSFTRLEGADFAPTDQGAVAGWADGRGTQNFIVATSNPGRQSGPESQLLLFSPVAAPKLLPAGGDSVAALAVADVDGDGDLDLFVAAQFVPGRYPEPASSSVWRNHEGQLILDEVLSAPFRAVGLVNGATFIDLDGDGDSDLVLALEWGPLRVFRNQKGHFEDATTALGFAAHTGLWTGVATGDFDGDGRLDLVAGNWGRNTTYELIQPSKLALFYVSTKDDPNVLMIEAWQSAGNWLPIRDRTWLARGFPDLINQFPTHELFSRATVQDIFGPRFTSARMLEAAELESAVFLNRGSHFERIPLPQGAQLAPVFSVNVGDFDGDGIEDIFLSQNRFGTADNLSRNDSGQGTWLRGIGDGTFSVVDASVTGINVVGEQRGAALADFNHDGRVDLAVSQNNHNTRLYMNQRAKPGLRVVLHGPPGNPQGIGSILRVDYGEGRLGPVRAVQAGSGYWSQDAVVQVLGLATSPRKLQVGWPGGRQQTMAVPDGGREIHLTY